MAKHLKVQFIYIYSMYTCAISYMFLALEEGFYRQILQILFNDSQHALTFLSDQFLPFC